MTDLLAQLSTVFIYAAMGVYVLAFIAFALDLARRGARATAEEAAVVPSAVARRTDAHPAGVERPAVLTSEASGGGGDGGPDRGATTTLTRLSSRISSRVEDEVTNGGPVSFSMRAAFVITIVGFAFHLVATVLRGIAADRVPWANMWEFSMTGTLVIIGVFLLVNLKLDLKYLGTFVLGLVLILLGIALVRYYVPVVLCSRRCSRTGWCCTSSSPCWARPSSLSGSPSRVCSSCKPGVSGRCSSQFPSSSSSCRLCPRRRRWRTLHTA